MKFEELKKVNAGLKTTDIKGKAYAEVNERIKGFRMLYPNGSIITEIVSLENGVVIIKATAMNEEGAIIATGHAYEKENSTFINKTSYIENAETSAVGRCLGMIGIGIDTSVASYEEVQNAMIQQNAPETAVTEPKKATTKKEEDYHVSLLNFIAKNNLNSKQIATEYKLTKASSNEQYKAAYEAVTANVDYYKIIVNEVK